jgi:threonine aldolase
LHEDHEHAAQLAKAFEALAPAVEVVSCDTNFVIIHLNSPKYAPASFFFVLFLFSTTTTAATGADGGCRR